jgi:hypothetical protein
MTDYVTRTEDRTEAWTPESVGDNRYGIIYRDNEGNELTVSKDGYPVLTCRNGTSPSQGETNSALGVMARDFLADRAHFDNDGYHEYPVFGSPMKKVCNRGRW